MTAATDWLGMAFGTEPECSVSADGVSEDT
jgi:hypothetical protein